MGSARPFPAPSPGPLGSRRQPPAGSARSRGAHRPLPQPALRRLPLTPRSGLGAEGAPSGASGVHGAGAPRKSSRGARAEGGSGGTPRARRAGLYANLQSPNSKSPTPACTAEGEPMCGEAARARRRPAAPRSGAPGAPRGHVRGDAGGAGSGAPPRRGLPPAQLQRPRHPALPLWLRCNQRPESS